MSNVLLTTMNVTRRRRRSTVHGGQEAFARTNHLAGKAVAGNGLLSPSVKMRPISNLGVWCAKMEVVRQHLPSCLVLSPTAEMLRVG